MKNLYVYRKADETDVKQFLLALPDKQRDKFIRQIAMLILPGDILGRPQVKHFQMDRYRCLYELRDKYQNTLVRIIFAYVADGSVVLLEAFIKDHKRKTDMALAAALEKLHHTAVHPSDRRQNTPPLYLLVMVARRIAPTGCRLSAPS